MQTIIHLSHHCFEAVAMKRYLLLLKLVLLTGMMYIEGKDALKYHVYPLKSIVQNDINALYKDSNGFMWIGTLDGLIRFDGSNTKTYRIQQGKNSISSNMITAITEDMHGNIWAATFGKGLCKLDPQTDTFTHYQQELPEKHRLKSNDISCFYIDGNTIWVGNWLGIYRIKLDEEMDEIIKNDELPLSQIYKNSDNLQVKRIFKDQSNNIWAGLNNGLIRLSNPNAAFDNLVTKQYNAQVSSYCTADSIEFIGGSMISIINKSRPQIRIDSILDIQSHILLYANKQLWTGNNKGIYSYTITPEKKLAADLHFTAETASNALSSNLISCIASDNSGQIWVGTNGGGITIISPKTKYFYHYKKNAAQQGSLKSNSIRNIFEDSQQYLWIGTEGGGLNYLKGKDKYNYASGFKQFNINNYPKENNRVYSIEETLTPRSKKTNRIIWLGTSYPINLMAINPNTMEDIALPEFTKNMGFVFSLEAQNDSTLWAGTYGEGLWRLSLNTRGEIIRHTQFSPNNESGCNLSSFIIRNILYDTKGNLWIGTDKGLNLIRSSELNKEQPTFEVYREGNQPGELSQDYILQLFESASGKIWMGTMGGGLVGIEKMDADSICFSALTSKDGLPNNAIKGILEDDRQNLWLSSNRGISKFNPITKEIINYDSSDGLQNDEFAEIVAGKRSNGQLLFGGNNGLNVFYADEILIDTLKPRLILTELLILNEKIIPGESYNNNIILNKNLEYTDYIVLKHNQNSFSIAFTGMQFNSAQKNNYKYLLEGFDKQYTFANADYTIAKYTNVPAGTYTFKVYGSNCDNVWSDTPAFLTIVVLPHPLLSAWAYLIYAIVLITVITIILKTTLLISRRKKELLIAGIEKKNTEELAQSKLRFFTNISHEIRTPLTLISVPLESLLKKSSEFKADDRKSLTIIKQNTHLMLRLVNQLLDFRKLEETDKQLHITSTDLNNFIKTIFESFKPLAEEKHIKLSFNAPEGELLVDFDSEKLEKVIYNLLSNALKFTPNEGTVMVSIHQKDKFVTITVSDTGIGISEDDKQMVFERYFQGQNSRPPALRGSGIGLALSKSIIELHQGHISLTSKEGMGSTFVVSLPLSQGNFHSLSTTVKPLANLHQDIVITSEIVKEKTAYTILVVEDNKDLREILLSIFAETFTVIEAENGRVGLEKCIEYNPHIVISDIMMPEMNGIELLTTIKNDERISHIPVILLSAKGSVEDQIEGHLSGADAYIPKPFNADYLYANVISTIKNRERLRVIFQKEIEINPMVISNSPADVKFMEKILALTEKNLSNPEFNVDKLAETYGVSRIHLNRKIKALTGETPIQFLRNIKLKHAAELLKQNSLNVSEVAWEVGYSDVGTFRKRFKEKFGVSPSEFEK